MRLIFILDLCAKTTCKEHSKCITLPDRRTQCVCESCGTNYDMVCGDDLKTYATMCRLKRSICLKDTPSKAVQQKSCGKYP